MFGASNTAADWMGRDMSNLDNGVLLLVFGYLSCHVMTTSFPFRFSWFHDGWMERSLGWRNQAREQTDQGYPRTDGRAAFCSLFGMI